MILVKVFVRQLFRIRNSVQIIFTVWTECTFIGEIEETMSLSLFLQGVSLSVFISVNIVNGPFGICVADYGLLETIWLERRKELWGEGFRLVDFLDNYREAVAQQIAQSSSVEPAVFKARLQEGIGGQSE